MELSNQTALITGASRGIGRAIAQKFAQVGARVAVHYHQNKPAAEKTLQSLAGEGHIIVQANTGDAVAVQSMVDQTVAEFGKLDILVNNAGMYEDHPLDTVDYAVWQATWQKILATNLVGPANASYCAGQYMLKQGGGRIINVGSRGGYRGEPTAPAYGASKAGLHSMSQSLAVHLGPHNILVTAVAPGFVDTKMAGFLDGPRGEAIKNQSPFKRVATADEVAHVVLFLATPGSEWVAGGVIDVNGASYLR